MLLASRLRNHRQTQDYEDLLLRFFFAKSFAVLVLMCRVLIDLGVTVRTRCEVGIELRSLAFEHLAGPAPSVERLLCPPLSYLYVLVENRLVINVRVYFWILGSILLIYTFIRMSGSNRLLTMVCSNLQNWEL